MFPNTVNQNVYFSHYKTSNINVVTKRNRSSHEFSRSLHTSLRRNQIPYRGTLTNSNGRINSNYRKVNNLSKPKFSTKYFKSSLPSSSKSSQYRWENRSKSSKPHVSVPPAIGRIGVTFSDESPLTRIVARQNTANHFGSEVPFFSVLSKGWLSDPPCDTGCVKRSFNLQSCCFIADKYLPTNTLNLARLGAATNIKTTTVDYKNSFVKLSEHKLIRKLDRVDRKPLKTVVDPSIVLCTKRKLIRERKSSANDKNTALPTAKSDFTLSVVRKENLETKSNSMRRSLFTIRKKRTTPLVVLTKRKLVRLREQKNEATRPEDTPKPATLQLLDDWLKRPSLKLPSRLIRVGRNKLIRSTLLRKTKQFKTNQSSPSSSVLSRMIQYRRLPCSRSSYVLLTRNKLIKKSKFKNRTWKKNSEIARSKVESKKRRSSKTFVSLGSNKLIRKSLFKKTNKISSQKNIAHITSPVRNKFLIRMLNSRRRRVQRFTNHWSRVNLRYVTNLPSLTIRNK